MTQSGNLMESSAMSGRFLASAARTSTDPSLIHAINIIMIIIRRGHRISARGGQDVLRTNIIQELGTNLKKRNKIKKGTKLKKKGTKLKKISEMSLKEVVLIVFFWGGGSRSGLDDRSF